MIDIFSLENGDITLRDSESPRFKNIRRQKGYYKSDRDFGLDLELFVNSETPFSITGFRDYLCEEFGKNKMKFEEVKVSFDKENFDLKIEVKE